MTQSPATPKFPVTISDEAKLQAWGMLCEAGSARFLRVYVEGGGCSGFNYGFSIHDAVNDDDMVLNLGDFSIVIDVFSSPYLEGASIEWKDKIFERSLFIKNPNAKSTCGCGSSFSF